MPEHYNAGDRMPEGVLLLDPATGLPVPTPAQGLTDAQLRATAVPVAATARACLGTFRVSVTTANACRLRGVLRWGQPLIAHH